MKINTDNNSPYKVADDKLNILACKGVKNLPIARKAKISSVKELQKFLESNGYQQLIKHPAPENFNEIYRIASMAYAWMPTMLEFYPNQITISRSKFTSLLKNLGKLNESDEKILLKNLTIFINHSLVGAVKTLHILNPNKYPLIDSRVIRGWNKLFPNKKCNSGSPCRLSTNILFTHHDIVNTDRLEAVTEQYFCYRKHLLEWVKTLNSKDSVRDIEFKLYLAGFRD